MYNLEEVLKKSEELLGRYQSDIENKTEKKERLLAEKRNLSFELSRLNAKISRLLGAKMFLKNYDSIIKEHKARVKHFALGSSLLMDSALGLVSIALASLPVFLLGSVICNVIVAIYCVAQYQYNTKKDRKLKKEHVDIETVEKEYQESIELRETYNCDIGEIDKTLEELNGDIEVLADDIQNLSYFVGYFVEQGLLHNLAYDEEKLQAIERILRKEEKESGKII